MKYLLIICFLLCFVNLTVNADSIRVDITGFDNGYTLTNLTTGSTLVGLCLDHSVSVQSGSAIEATVVTLESLRNSADFQKYIQASYIANLWNNPAVSREGIQKAIWKVFESDYLLPVQYQYLLTVGGVYNPNQLVVIPNVVGSSQRYLIPTEVPELEPLYLVILGTFFLFLANKLNIKKANG